MKLHSYIKTAALLSTLIFGVSAYAKRVDVKWGSIPGAEKYEYQLSRTDTFSSELVRSGTTKNVYFGTDIGPGIYFLRVRGLEDSGRSGAWSQSSRIIVEASSLEVQKPSANELVEVSGPTAPFFVEWSPVEGAGDYQVQLKQGATVRNIVAPTNSVRVEGLNLGQWTVAVMARVGAQVIQKSKDVNFRIINNLKPKPVIYSPISGETTVAWDNFAVKWLNTSKNPKSEVVVRRLGDKNGIISREIVVGRAETYTPKLPPGNYQISVKNIYDSVASEAALADVTTKEDVMGYHAQYLGVSGEIVLGPTFGTTGFHKASYDADTHKGANGSGEAEFRLAGDVYREWGFETGIGMRADRFSDQIPVTADDTENYAQISTTRIAPHITFGARYRLEPLGSSKPLWLRAWLFWRGIEMPVGANGVEDGVAVGTPKFRYSNARIWGTGLGAEMRWGGGRSRWDAIGRFDMLIPWIARGAVLATGGVSPMWPTMELRVIPRIKVSSEVRLGLILGGRFESLTLKEKSSDNSKLSSYRVFMMPTLNWDM